MSLTIWKGVSGATYRPEVWVNLSQSVSRVSLRWIYGACSQACIFKVGIVADGSKVSLQFTMPQRLDGMMCLQVVDVEDY